MDDINIIEIRNAVLSRRVSDICEDMSKLTEFLLELRLNGFYGGIVMKYENGNIVSIKKEESIKL